MLSVRLPLTCMLLKRAWMEASSSAALRRTSSTMACSSTMASRVAVCRAFTAWEQGGLSLVGVRVPRPGRRAPRAHQHRLLQPLAALHVG